MCGPWRGGNPVSVLRLPRLTHRVSFVPIGSSFLCPAYTSLQVAVFSLSPCKACYGSSLSGLPKTGTLNLVGRNAPSWTPGPVNKMLWGWSSEMLTHPELQACHPHAGFWKY